MNKIQQIKQNMIQTISIEKITMLKELNHKIRLNKNEVIKIFTSNFGLMDIYSFITNLEDDKIYIIIPILSINNIVDEPYIMLSQQILVTNNSNPKLLINFISNKIQETGDLYGTTKLDQCKLQIKYKSVEIEIYQ